MTPPTSFSTEFEQNDHFYYKLRWCETGPSANSESVAVVTMEIMEDCHSVFLVIIILTLLNLFGLMNLEVAQFLCHCLQYLP
jgi:hypothetical protein